MRPKISLGGDAKARNMETPNDFCIKKKPNWNKH
jgi:hypothetical protein